MNNSEHLIHMVASKRRVVKIFNNTIDHEFTLRVWDRKLFKPELTVIDTDLNDLKLVASNMLRK